MDNLAPFGAGPDVVEPEPRAALPFGLFSIVSFRPSQGERWLNGVEWEAMTCDPVSGIEWEDLSCDPVSGVEHYFGTGTSRGQATAFSAYGSYKCGTPGGRVDAKAEGFATAHLLAREQATVEKAVWDRMAAEATDVHGSGSVTPAEGLALLEDWIGGTYGSLGIIHGQRGAISSLGKGARPSGQRLLSRIGTPLVAGGGYTNPGSTISGNTAGAGEAWMLASPTLFGYRSEIRNQTVFDHRNNDMYALAERDYVIGFDPCGVGAVRIDIIG